MAEHWTPALNSMSLYEAGDKKVHIITKWFTEWKYDSKSENMIHRVKSSSMPNVQFKVQIGPNDSCKNYIVFTLKTSDSIVFRGISWLSGISVRDSSASTHVKLCEQWTSNCIRVTFRLIQQLWVEKVQHSIFWKERNYHGINCIHRYKSINKQVIWGLIPGQGAPYP